MASSINTTLPRSLYHTPTGWVDEPHIRGTMGLIWNCLLVLFTCTWTVLHVNLPAPDEGSWSIFLRKTRWAASCVYAPEAVSLIAAVQRQSARRSVGMMHQLGVISWTPVHGFFADMGGFRLRSSDMPTFPINTKAIHYLVKHGYIKAPTVNEKYLRDKGKADNFAKIAACVQSGWMLLQVIARPIVGLEVTPLELLTVAMAMCSAVSFYLWMDKPLGVEVAIDLDLKCTVSRVLSDAGSIAKEQWQDTPMDFVEQPGWKEWKRRAWMREFGGLKERPIQRIPKDYLEPPKTFTLAVCTWFLGCAYAAIHVAGWNFAFPSAVEVQIWRWNCALLFAVLFGWGFVEVLTVRPGLDFNFTLFGIWRKKSTKNSFLRKTSLDVPGTISAVLFFVARTIIVVEAVVALRSLPGSCYANVKWASFLPHV